MADTSSARKPPKTIGEMNGWAAMLLKINLVFLPIVLTSLIGLNVWLVTSNFDLQKQIAVLTQRLDQFAAVGPRYTPDMAERDMLRLKEELRKEIAEAYPPKWLKDTVESHGRRLQALESTPRAPALP